MKRLQISSVSDVSFGVHRDRFVDDLAHDFVCVLGPNESGKSTLAEFLQWSIGGTSGSAAWAERFVLSDGGRQLKGRVRGALDGVDLDIAAKFKILQRGAPNDDRTGDLGGSVLDVRGLASALGGVNPDDYAQIHRVRGAELVRSGEADTFSTLFTQFSVGSASASINPRARLAELQTRLKETEKQLKDLARKDRDLRARLREADQRPTEVDELEMKVSELKRQGEVLNADIGKLQRQRVLVDRARNILPARLALGNAHAELEQHGELSESWRAVARISGTISEAQAAAEAARANVSDREHDFTEARNLVGLPADVLKGAELSITDRGNLLDAAQQIRETSNAFDRRVTERDELSASIERHALEISATAATLGVTSSTGKNLLGKETSLRDLLTDAGIWVETENAAAVAESTAAARQAEIEALRTNPGAPPTVPARRFPARVVVLIAGLVLAVGASMVSPLAAIAVAVAAILASLLLPERSAPSVTTNDEAFETARRAFAEATRLAEAERNRAGAKSADLRRALEALGAPPVPELALARSHIQQLADLAASVTTQENDSVRLSTLNANVIGSEAQVIGSRSQLNELLSARGVITTPSTDHFDEWLGHYEAAIASARALTEAWERAQSLELERDALVEPVVQDLADLSWPQRLAHIAEMVERLGAVELAERKRRDAQIILDAIGDEAPEIEELLHRCPDEVALLAHHEVLSAEIALLEESNRQLIIAGRDLELEIRDLTDTEVLAALNEQQVTLAEQIDDAERSRMVLAHSVAILTEVIDRFEVENQAPAVKRTQSMLQEVVHGWGDLILNRDPDGKVLIERRSGSNRLLDSKLSDGARSLLYLSLRLAFAADDAERRGVALPMLCDDPLVHLDDDRRDGALALLADAARTHQVLLFTCDTSTATLAQQNGAHVVTL